MIFYLVILGHYFVSVTKLDQVTEKIDEVNIVLDIGTFVFDRKEGNVVQILERQEA